MLSKHLVNASQAWVVAEMGGVGGGGGEGARGCGHALVMPPGVGSGEAGARWGVSGGGEEGAGGCGHALAALRINATRCG